MLRIKKPCNDLEFSAMMEEVDEWLKSENVPIPARPLRAISEISKALNLARLRIAPLSDSAPRPGVYEGEDFVKRLHEWYEQRYGEKLLLQMGPGRGVIKIKGDVFETVFPKIWGEVHFFIEKDTPSSESLEDLKHRRIPRLNVLDTFKDLTVGMRQSITRDEARVILTDFADEFSAMEAVYSDPKMPMAAEIKSDLNTAVENMLSQPPHYGQSKWASLQASEKAIKSKLRAGGESFPHIHDLSKLAQRLEGRFGISLSSADLAAASCSADARYGDLRATLDDAYNGYRAALRICRECSSEPDSFSVTSNPYPL